VSGRHDERDRWEETKESGNNQQYSRQRLADSTADRPLAFANQGSASRGQHVDAGLSENKQTIRDGGNIRITATGFPDMSSLRMAWMALMGVAAT